MACNLAAEAGERRAPFFPYSNRGPMVAVLGVLLALATGLVLAAPAALIGYAVGGEHSGANVGAQFATAVGFVLVPMVIAGRWGATSAGEALTRLGVRRFRRSALGWMAVAIGAYYFLAAVYSAILGPPHQKDIAEGFGAVPVKVLLIVIAAPVSEEICFRGMLFGGLRERLPRIAAALISAVIFGALHAITGLSAVPPLIAFGFILALLYEKTGSVIPGILLHALNNSVALLAQ